VPRHLILRLDAPLMAFGDVMIDRLGPVRDTPASSTISGLLANALGYVRWDTERLGRLQERLVFGCRVDRRGQRLTDFQTAQLAKDDTGWTTRGRVEGRAGGDSTYESPHIRERDYRADACVTVALRLLDSKEAPTLDDVARALEEPARPLFLGRKPCLPARPLLAGEIDAPTVYDALLSIPFACEPTVQRRFDADDLLRIVLPADEPRPPGFRDVSASERRDWPAGVHAGDIITYHGDMPRDAFVASATGAS
jgi:CRISPR system Cascade subunit CasD